MAGLTYVDLGFELAPRSDMHEVAAFSHAALSALPEFAAQQWWLMKRSAPNARGVGTPSLAVLDNPNATHGWIAMAKNGSVGLMSYAHLHKTNRAWRLNSPDKLDGWSLGFIVKELDKLAAPKCTALLRSLRDIAKRAEKQLDVGRFFLDAHPSPSREIKTLKGVEAQFRAWLK